MSYHASQEVKGDADGLPGSAKQDHSSMTSLMVVQ
jgi:hypothetical protein